MSKNVALNAILVRHAQTEANRDGVAQGQTDSPIAAEGVAGAIQKAAKLNKYRFSAVYCSDLARAVKTVKILGEAMNGLPEPVFEPLLREIDFGDYSGMKKEEIMPHVMRHKADLSMKYPNGESGNDLITRTRSFFEMLLEKHRGQTVLVVTHYGIMETAAKQFAGYPKDERVTIGETDVWEMTFVKGKAELRII